MNDKIKGTTLKLPIIEEIVDAYLGGFYSFDMIDDIFKVSQHIVKSVLSNKELIENYFGEETYNNIRKKANIVANLSDCTKGKELIRCHLIRKIVKPDVLYVDPYIKKTLKLVMLFIKYEGNLDIINEETKINKNEIINQLNNNEIKNLLLPEILDYYLKVLEIENNLFCRNCLEIDDIIKRVVYLKDVLKYKEERISIILDLPLSQINRMLLDPYTLVKYNKYKYIDITEEEILKENILNMYELVVNKGLSLRQVGKIFNLSNVTVSSYMNNNLMKISLNKYLIVQDIISKNNTNAETLEKLTEITEMKKLYDDGYTINQIAIEFEKVPSTIYRKLVSEFPELKEKMKEKRMQNLSLNHK